MSENWADESLRSTFRQFNRAMVVMWRLGLGRWAEVWPTVGGRMMVVEHFGRKSGTRYLTPLNFTHGEGEVYAVAAFGSRTDWFRNLLASSDAMVWLPHGAWKAKVSDADDSAERLDTVRRVLIDSGFAAPAFGIHPRSMSDEELATLTADYRLVRFDLIEPADSPIADLGWIWAPIVAFVAGVIVALARRSRSQ